MILNLTAAGAVADARLVLDAVMTAASPTLASATANFVAGDVGKKVTVGGAGSGGAKLQSTIAAFVSSTVVTLADPASTSGVGLGAAFGTDCAPALQGALDALIAAQGGTLVIDGMFYLGGSVLADLGGDSSGVSLRIVATGSDGGFYVSVPESGDALKLSSGAVDIEHVNFVGIPAASRDAGIVLHLLGIDATLRRCGFHGLIATTSIIHSHSSILTTDRCAFGGSFVAGNNGYVNSVISNLNWVTYSDRDSQFIDYGYFRGQLHSKSGFGSTRAWVQAGNPSASTGARAAGVMRMVGTRLDEATQQGIVAHSTAAPIQAVELLGLRHNVSPSETARGLHCQNVTNVLVRNCTHGLTETPSLFASFHTCGTVLIDGEELTEAVNGIDATDVGALIIRDSSEVAPLNLVNSSYFPETSALGGFAKVKRSAASDSDFAAPPGPGVQVLDELNGRIYRKLPSGGWAYWEYSGGDLLGPSIVVNGQSPLVGTTGWAAEDGSISVVNGRLRVTNGGTYGQAYQAVVVEPLKEYRFRARKSAGTAGGEFRLGYQLAGTQFGSSQADSLELTIIPGQSPVYISLLCWSTTPGQYCDFYDIAIQAV